MRGGADAVTVQTSIRTHVLGGDGTDTYFGSTTSTGTNVFFVGGPGDRDEANYGRSTSGVAVDLDGASDDGRIGVDTDNITGTVERLSGTDHADSLRGNNASNSIFGGKGADSLRGGGGNDEIVASELNTGGATADKDLSCGTGNDVVQLDKDDPAPAACETVRRTAAGRHEPGPAPPPGAAQGRSPPHIRAGLGVADGDAHPPDNPHQDRDGSTSPNALRPGAPDQPSAPAMA